MTAAKKSTKPSPPVKVVLPGKKTTAKKGAAKKTVAKKATKKVPKKVPKKKGQPGPPVKTTGF